MSFWTQVEQDFQAVASSADTVLTKLENMVGIRTRAQEHAALEGQITAIVDDTTKTTAEKVDAILTAMGK